MTSFLSLYAAMFPMPRVVYSLASDGLIFRGLSYVLPGVKTPVTAALASGFFAGVLCLIFDLEQLIDMMSIGTLMAYSVVSICVLILRYRPDSIKSDIKQELNDKDLDEYENIDSSSQVSLFHLIVNPAKYCCKASAKLVSILSVIGGKNWIGLMLRAFI